MLQEKGKSEAKWCRRKTSDSDLGSRSSVASTWLEVMSWHDIMTRSRFPFSGALVMNFAVSETRKEENSQRPGLFSLSHCDYVHG
jgi:hypothetical protein